MNQSNSDDAELFADAVKGLREVEPVWGQQVEMALGHRVELILDYESLGGKYQWIQPLIHQALTGGLGALSRVAFSSPASRERLEVLIRRLVIRGSDAGKGCFAELGDGVLTIGAPLVADGPAPEKELATLIEKLMGQGEGRIELPAPIVMKEPEPANSVAVAGDRYTQADSYMAKLEAALRESDLWPERRPSGPIEVKGAFGCENMTFPQWLAWVFIPRVREIVAERGEFPASSEVGAYAVREFDGVDEAGDVISILSEFDEMIERN